MRFKAALVVDLPSDEIYQQPGRMARFFGVKPKPTGEERVVGSTMTILERTIDAFRDAGVSNVIALRIDDRTIYHDDAMVEDDLDAMIAALDRQRSVLDDHFQVIHLVMEHHAAGLHCAVDAKIRGQVKTSEEEVAVIVSAQVDDLRPGEGEAATAFRERVRGLLAEEGLFDRYLVPFEGFLNDLLVALRTRTRAVQDRVEYARAGIFKPNRASLEDLGRKRFEEHRVSFRDETPDIGSLGYYQDPYSHYYYDPTTAFADVIILDRLLQRRAAGVPPDAIIHTPYGGRIGRAGRIVEFADEIGDVAAMASAEAAAAFDSGALLTDPVVAASLDDFGPAGEVAFEPGDSGLFETGGELDDPEEAWSSCSSCAADLLPDHSQASE